MALLTAKAIEQWKPSGQELKPCGNRLGLYVRGSATGAKTFYWRKAGKWYALGEFRAELSLTDATERAAECNRLYKQGQRPDEIIQALRGLESASEHIPEQPSKAQKGRIRAAKGVTTYDDAFEAYCAAYELQRQAGPSRRQLRTLHNHVPDSFKALPVSEIRRGDVFDWMLRLLGNRYPAGRKLRSLMDGVFEFAINKGLCSDNPIPSQRSFRIAAPKPKPHASLDYQRLPELWRWLGGIDYRRPPHTAIAIKLAILSAHRIGVVQAARWEHFDLDARQWVIPERRDKERAGYMKSGRSHTFTLPEGFMSELLRIKGDSPYLFPSLGRAKYISNTSIRKMLRLFDSNITAHGFRNSFKTWARSENVSDWVADAYVDHSLKGLDASYRREDPKRIISECAKVTEALYAYVAQ